MLDYEKGDGPEKQKPKYGRRERKECLYRKYINT